jgi:SET domain-containing protein
MPRNPSRQSRSRTLDKGKPYRVGRSPTGLGLFATANIAKGAFIIAYQGRRISHAQAERLEARGAKYVFEIDSRWSIDGSSRRNTMRYANHSCRPNAESDLVEGKVILRAIKTIKPGDEITYDYGKEYFELFIKPVGCKCEKCVEERRARRSSARRSDTRRSGRS